jgi:hypothetical protein
MKANEKVSAAKNLCKSILKISQFIVHPSIDESHLKVNVKSRGYGMRYLSDYELAEIELETNQKAPTDIAYYKDLKKEIHLMTWENGIEYYESAFFSERLDLRFSQDSKDKLEEIISSCY